MTIVQKRLAVDLPVLALLGMFLAIPATVSADVRPAEEGNRQQMANRLEQFKKATLELRREADTVAAYKLNPQLHWKTHGDSLTLLKEHVNDLGKSLAELENEKAVGNESHQMAIESARPHLEEVAQNLTRAFHLLNNDRNSVRGPEYVETVGDLYLHADLMYEKLDTILDYDNASERLENMNFQPASNLER